MLILVITNFLLETNCHILFIWLLLCDSCVIGWITLLFKLLRCYKFLRLTFIQKNLYLRKTIFLRVSYKYSCVKQHMFICCVYFNSILLCHKIGQLARARLYKRIRIVKARHDWSSNTELHSARLSPRHKLCIDDTHRIIPTTHKSTTQLVLLSNYTNLDLVPERLERYRYKTFETLLNCDSILY